MGNFLLSGIQVYNRMVDEFFAFGPVNPMTNVSAVPFSIGPVVGEGQGSFSADVEQYLYHDDQGGYFALGDRDWLFMMHFKQVGTIGACGLIALGEGVDDGFDMWVTATGGLGFQTPGFDGSYTVHYVSPDNTLLPDTDYVIMLAYSHSNTTYYLYLNDTQIYSTIFQNGAIDPTNRIIFFGANWGSGGTLELGPWGLWANIIPDESGIAQLSGGTPFSLFDNGNNLNVYNYHMNSLIPPVSIGDQVLQVHPTQGYNLFGGLFYKPCSGPVAYTTVYDVIGGYLTNSYDASGYLTQSVFTPTSGWEAFLESC